MGIKKKLMHLHRDLVLAQQLPVVGSAARALLWSVMGIDIPQSVQIGKNFQLVHGGYGVVVYRGTQIKDGVTIYQGVTIGLKDLRPDDQPTKIVIEDGAILCAGAKIMAPADGLRVGKNTVIGANAVLLNSTGDDEVWAGVPAKKISVRKKA